MRLQVSALASPIKQSQSVSAAAVGLSDAGLAGVVRDVR